MPKASNSPLPLFTQWLEQAKATPSITEPTAMTLATATKEGMPSARIVLLKGFDERGFVFYTNLESHKSTELKANPYAALCLYWMPLERQIRIEGRTEAVSAAEADEYFASRPRESRIGAWSSAQSRPLDAREALVAKVAEVTKTFEGRDVPRPPHWGGWRLVPERIEFWSQGEFRLHDRLVYERMGDEWKTSRLWP